MQDVHEIAELISAEIRISTRKAKEVIRFLRARGLMPAGDMVDGVTRMKHYIGRGQNLTLQQLVTLIENPTLLKAMGAKAAVARKQIEALGDPVKHKADSSIGAFAVGTADRDRDSIARFGAWVKATIPPEGCSYHYLALRVIYGAHENFRPSLIRRMQFAFLVLRGHESFAGWFTVTKDSKGRSETFYHRPKNSL